MKKVIVILFCIFCLIPTLSHAADDNEGHYHLCIKQDATGAIIWLEDYQVYWYNVCTFMFT